MRVWHFKCKWEPMTNLKRWIPILMLVIFVTLTFVNNKVHGQNQACNKFWGFSKAGTYVRPGCGTINGCHVVVCAFNQVACGGRCTGLPECDACDNCVDSCNGFSSCPCNF